MNTQFARVALAAALACLAIGCSKEKPAPPAAVTAAAVATPDGATTAVIKNLRDNNVGGVLAAALPPAKLDKIKSDWSKEVNKEPLTEEDKAKFVENMSKLTAPGAEDKLFAELEPQLKQMETQMAQQMPMMIAMGQGFVQSSVQQSKDLDEAQKKQALEVVDAVAKWAGTAKFTDANLAKQGIAIVTKTARDLNLKTLDEARALSFDQAMQKAGIVFGGVKKVLDVYGFSIDKSLDSAKVDLLASQGDTAKVKVTYTLLGTPLTSETEMVKVDGRWYGKQMKEQLEKMDKESASTADPASKDSAK
jgi:hypothetical protein